MITELHQLKQRLPIISYVKPNDMMILTESKLSHSKKALANQFKWLQSTLFPILA